MANFSTSNKYPTLIQTLYTAVDGAVQLFQQFATVDTRKSASLRFVADDPIGNPASWDGVSGVTAQRVGASHVSTLTQAIYKKESQIPWRDADLDPSLPGQKASEMARMYVRWLDALAASALESGFSSLTVDDGASGTTAFFSAGHTLADSSTQSSLLTSALSSSSLATARARMSAWKSFRSQALGLGSQPLALVVHPNNADLARSIVGSPYSYTYDTPIQGPAGGASAGNTQMASNPFGGQILVVENPHLSVDPDDWFLMPRNDSPLIFWAETPTFRVIDSERDGATYIQVECNAACGYISPHRNVGIGSNVA